MPSRILLRSARLGTSTPAFRQFAVSRSCQSRMLIHATNMHWAYSDATSVSSSGEPDIYDVVCVGGGPAGLSLLTALRKLAFMFFLG